MSRGAPDDDLVALIRARARDAMAFLAVESGMHRWRDDPAPEGTDALVAYVDTGSAWVAACSPMVEGATAGRDDATGRAALRFVAAARAAGRRASFFGTESLEARGLSRLLVGEQPLYRPAEWLQALPSRRGLKEQLRRARAKGLRVRKVDEAELVEGAPLRAEVERLARAWLRDRHIEPMAFLVALEPFHAAPAHRYFLAEARGRPVGFLSAVPAGPRGWLVEDVVRDAAAPNGTTESLVVALFRDVEDSDFVTLGLTPLSGPVPWPLRVARWISRPLFDFEGLRAFRERLRPHRWDPVWLAHPEGSWAAVALLDGLRAFAGGSLVAFAARSLLRHPSGLPWALALPLPAWTLVLAGVALSGHAAWLGFPTAELGLWVAFDALLLLVLVRAARRPQRAYLVAATALAALDAALSVGHLAWTGAGHGALQTALRGIATAAPLLGTALLAWSTTRTAHRAPAGRPPVA